MLDLTEEEVELIREALAKALETLDDNGCDDGIVLCMLEDAKKIMEEARYLEV